MVPTRESDYIPSRVSDWVQASLGESTLGNEASDENLVQVTNSLMSNR